MKRTRKYKATLVAAVVAGFAFLPQAYAADTAYETDTVKVEAEGVDKYLVTTNKITEQEIKDRGYRDLADILSQVPGLYMTYEGKQDKMIRVRGAESSQTKVYIDGIPAFTMNGVVSQSATDFSTIPADNIEKIEVIKGSGPVRYGTDYKGGVILVTTKKGDGDGRFRVSFAGGSHHTYDAKLGYSGSDKNVGYAFNISKRHTAGYMPNTADHKFYFDGKVIFKTSSKSTLMLNGYYSNMNREVSQSVNPATRQPAPYRRTAYSVEVGDGITLNMKRQNKSTDWYYKGFRQSDIALQYDSHPNDKWWYDIKYYHVTDQNNLWVRNLLTSEGGTLPHFTSGAPQWYRSGWFARGNGIESNASTALGDQHQLSFGAKYIKLDWDTDANNTSFRREGSDNRKSFYIEDAWSISPKTRMTLGVRHEHLSQDYKEGTATSRSSSASATDPVLNITHDFSKKDKVRLSAGRSHVFIGAKDASSNIREGYPLPSPERDRNYELGWQHTFKSNAVVDLSLFRTDVSNRITSVMIAPNTFVYKNVDKTHIRGLELGYHQKFSPKFFGFANYTWMKAEDEQNGMRTRASGLPTQMFNFGVTYREGKLRSTLLGRALRARLTKVGEAESAGYFTADLDLRYEPQKDLGVFLRINNLFNTDYWYHSSYPADGTNFLLGVDMTF